MYVYTLHVGKQGQGQELEEITCTPSVRPHYTDLSLLTTLTGYESWDNV